MTEILFAENHASALSVEFHSQKSLTPLKSPKRAAPVAGWLNSPSMSWRRSEREREKRERERESERERQRERERQCSARCSLKVFDRGHR